MKSKWRITNCCVFFFSAILFKCFFFLYEFIQRFVLQANVFVYRITDYDRPESRLSFVNNKNMEVDLAQLSILNDGDKKQKVKSEDEKRLDGACGGMDEEEEEEDEKMDEDFDLDSWTLSLAPRYKCEDGECSVQSCMNQFTACELMTGSNKVACELCTKRHGGPDKKHVYTDARKQLLIYNPPAVLILHLKRFQVSSIQYFKTSFFFVYTVVTYIRYILL